MKHLSICAVVAVLLSSCSLVQQQSAPAAKEEADRVMPPMYLGEVHQVYPSQGFALLRIIGPLPRAGVTLITHPVDGSTSRMGNLVISDDSSPRNGMVAANIRSGTVASGDRVFLYRNIAQGAEDEPELPRPVSRPAAPEADAPAANPPLHVYATRDDLPQQKPQEAQKPDAAPIPDPVEPPATSPQLPSGPITLPSTPDTPPAYLNDIPDDVNQWN